MIEIKIEDNKSNSDKIKIGVGVGVGVVAAAALAAGLLLLRRRKDKSSIFDNEELELHEETNDTMITTNPLNSIMDEDDPFEDEFY